MIHSMVAHLDAVTSLAVDPNGLYLLSGSEFICIFNIFVTFAVLAAVTGFSPHDMFFLFILRP